MHVGAVRHRRLRQLARRSVGVLGRELVRDQVLVQQRGRRRVLEQPASARGLRLERVDAGDAAARTEGRRKGTPDRRGPKDRREVAGATGADRADRIDRRAGRAGHPGIGGSQRRPGNHGSHWPSGPAGGRGSRVARPANRGASNRLPQRRHRGAVGPRPQWRQAARKHRSHVNLVRVQWSDAAKPERKAHPGPRSRSRAEPPGSNCASGGERIDVGEVVDGGFDIQQTAYVCNGGPGGTADAEAGVALARRRDVGR